MPCRSREAEGDVLTGQASTLPLDRERALQVLRERLDPEVLSDLAGRIELACAATAHPEHRLRERHVVADFRVRGGRVHDAEMASPVVAGSRAR